MTDSGRTTPDRVPELPKSSTLTVFLNALMLLREHYEWGDIENIVKCARIAQTMAETEATRS